MAFSHANCDHPSTPAARKKCRDNQKKLAEGKIKDTKNTRELQIALTAAYREQLLQIGSFTSDEVVDMLVGMDVYHIDEWFSGKLPDMMKVVEAQHREAMLLTTKYLQEHAALMGYTAGKIETIAPVFEQITKSLEVTGPVAFKTNIAAGGTVDTAADVMKTTLAGSAERLALDGARDTLVAAVDSETSNVLGYQRETSSTACDYCRGLSKEAIYDTDTFHAHDHCHCTGEPIYLDPRFLPTSSQVDFEEAWNNTVVNTDERAIELDKEEGIITYGGKVDPYLLESYGPLMVWKDLSETIRDKSRLRGIADRTEGKDSIRWHTYAESLRLYTSEVYDSMNRRLRGLERAAHRADNIPGSELYLSDEFIDNMNKYLLDYFKREAVTLPNDYQLYRGIKDARIVFGKYADGDLTGTVFRDKGFTSTTLNKKTSEDFIKSNVHTKDNHNPIMMRIIGKKGTKVVGGNGAESEIIFPPGVRYRVVRDYTKSVEGGTHRWLDVEIIGD